MNETTPAPSVSGDVAGQYRIRDLLLVTLALGVLLGLGRAFGGGVGQGEVFLLMVSAVSIGVGSVFLMRRWVWSLCVAASFFLALAVIPSTPMVRMAMGGVIAMHFFLAGMPLLALGPENKRWPWTAAAAGCQLAAALFSPPDAPSMVTLAVAFSWALAIAALAWRYYRLRTSR